ncbi:MAG: V-type ATP synthase subunit E [Oscillibacter sp.]|nr:V-type ATP synthase subunit E [Oscillibacter sp.]
MNGIERIIERLTADAQEEFDGILSAAQAEADKIAASYRAQAERDAADLEAKSEKAAKEREERLVSAAQMEARKTVLAGKQEVMNAVYERALAKLRALPDDAYTKVLATLLAQAAPDGCGEVIFSEQDRARVGQAAVDAANAKLSGKLTLAEETRPTQGGFILKNNNVEVNCTFDTLVRLQKAETAGQVAEKLFS